MDRGQQTVRRGVPDILALRDQGVRVQFKPKVVNKKSMSSGDHSLAGVGGKDGNVAVGQKRKAPASCNDINDVNLADDQSLSLRHLSSSPRLKPTPFKPIKSLWEEGCYYAPPRKKQMFANSTGYINKQETGTQESAFGALGIPWGPS